MLDIMQPLVMQLSEGDHIVITDSNGIEFAFDSNEGLSLVTAYGTTRIDFYRDSSDDDISVQFEYVIGKATHARRRDNI
jgi:hypothetical protein